MRPAGLIEPKMYTDRVRLASPRWCPKLGRYRSAQLRRPLQRAPDELSLEGERLDLVQQIIDRGCCRWCAPNLSGRLPDERMKDGGFLNQADSATVPWLVYPSEYLTKKEANNSLLGANYTCAAHVTRFRI